MTRRDDAAFTKEVEPGLYVYSVDADLPASTRRIIEDALDHSQEAAAEIHRVIAARRNGDGS